MEKGSDWEGWHWAWPRGVMEEVERGGQSGGVYEGNREGTVLMG